jgi:hypothetical protein
VQPGDRQLVLADGARCDDVACHLAPTLLATVRPILREPDHARLSVARPDLVAAAIRSSQVVFTEQLREVHLIVQHRECLLLFSNFAIHISQAMRAH